MAERSGTEGPYPPPQRSHEAANGRPGRHLFAVHAYQPTRPVVRRLEAACTRTNRYLNQLPVPELVVFATPAIHAEIFGD